jgi:hypothetical protein
MTLGKEEFLGALTASGMPEISKDFPVAEDGCIGESCGSLKGVIAAVSSTRGDPLSPP